MADNRVSDPSKLHLKKELTQIRKAARVLRDPGTTSSWRSPLSSTRSMAAAVTSTSARKNVDSRRQDGKIHLDSRFPLRVENSNGKENKAFLYNWKNYKSSSEKSAVVRHADNDDDDGGDDGSSSIQGSVDDSSSDARNGAGNSKSDTYLGEDTSSSMIFRRRDGNPASLFTPSINQVKGFKKKSKKNDSHHLDASSRYQQKEIILARNSVNSRRVLEGSHPSLAFSLDRDRDDSVYQSSDTEYYYNSEGCRQSSAASPLLLKLKRSNWSLSSSTLLRNSRKEDSSYSYSTPALSTSSYNRYVNHNASTVGSWVATTASLNNGDEDMDDHLDLPGRQGCGIPCYWSKRTPTHRGMCRNCYSPSFSDALRRKGSSMLCGSQSMYSRRQRSSSASNKRRIASRSAQGILPFLSNSGDGRGGSSTGTEQSDDELSTNFGELDLEALSRLDGRRWSASCRSHDGLDIVALNREGEEEGTPENVRSLSHKYKPMFFDELIGQNIVVQSLTNAISRGRIAPVYLFQGPRGTGKSSIARIFSAALNCLATEETKPCGYCRKCSNFISGKSKDILEVDGTNKKGIDKVRHLSRNLLVNPPSATSRYKVFVIDQCHLLPSKTWLAFLKVLEEPPKRGVFIFVTTDLDNVPHAVQSRCQKFLFNKIKDGDIVAKLKKISAEENMDVESDALELIALNADGSLRDAETMLDQLSLLGKRITKTLVNELVGVVSDEKLLELLELAMSSDTAETVKRARELMDSGVDPMVLMSQMASLIMDIIAGTYKIVDAKDNGSPYGGRSVTEAESERLKHALKLLSEAEKQLRVSSERSTWFTATLLQLGSATSSDLTQSGSSRRQNSKATEEDSSFGSRETTYKLKLDAHRVHSKSTSPASLHKEDNGSLSNQGNMISRYTSSENLDDIWAHCIEKCHSKTLRQLLHAYGKLVSISKIEGVLVAFVAFGDGDIKSRAERFMSSITNSIETVLRCNIEVRIILLPDGKAYLNNVNPVESPVGLKQMRGTVELKRERKAVLTNTSNGYSDLNSHQQSLKVSRGSNSDLEGKLKGAGQDYRLGSPLLQGTYQSIDGSSELLAEGNEEVSGMKERRQEIPLQRIETIISEQRLETAWLQAVEKGTHGSLSHSKPEKNQVLPQDGSYHQSLHSSGFSSQCWEDELNHDLKVLKNNNGKVLQKDQLGGRVDHYPISPSLLHDSSLGGNSNKDNLGYESGSGTGGCAGLFCWNNAKPDKRGKVIGTPVKSRKRRSLLFGVCGKSKESRFRRHRKNLVI